MPSARPSTQIGHSSFVTTVAAVPAGALQQFPGETVVSGAQEACYTRTARPRQGTAISHVRCSWLAGSRDLSVIIWDKDTGSPAAKLYGHQYQVQFLNTMKLKRLPATLNLAAAY